MMLSAKADGTVIAEKVMPQPSEHKREIDVAIAVPIIRGQASIKGSFLPCNSDNGPDAGPVSDVNRNVVGLDCYPLYKSTTI